MELIKSQIPWLFHRLISLVFIIFFGSSLLSCSNPEDLKLKGKVAEWVQAENNYNIEKYLSFFADSVTIEMLGKRQTYHKNTQRDLLEYHAVVKHHRILDKIKVKGDRVSCRFIDTDECLRLLYIDEFIWDNVQITFENGLIKEIKVRFRLRDIHPRVAAYKEVAFWAKKHRPEELQPGTVLHEYLTVGDLVYSKDRAEKWLILIKKWKKWNDKHTT